MCRKCFTVDICVHERKKHHKVKPCHCFAPLDDHCDDKHRFDPCDFIEKICDCFCDKCKKKKHHHHHHDHHHHGHHHDHHHHCRCDKCGKKKHRSYDY